MNKLKSKANVNLTVVLIFLILVSFISIIAAIALGPVTVSSVTVFRVLIGKSVSQLEYNIVWGLRLPRVLLGFIVGVAMQALVRNHLADPCWQVPPLPSAVQLGSSV